MIEVYYALAFITTIAIVFALWVKPTDNFSIKKY